MLKRYSILSVVMALLLVLGACGSNNEESQDNAGNEEEIQSSVEVDEAELMPEDEVIVVVNGSEVKGKTYNVVYSQLKLSASQMGEKVDLDEMKKTALDSIIDRELLMQAAEDEGIEVTEEKAEDGIASIKESNEDGLDTILEQYQMTEDEFKEQLKFELALDEYKNSLSDIEVTDEEIEDHYNQAKKDIEDMPKLEEIKWEIEQQVKEQKMNEALQERIDQLKASADIEKKINV